MEESTRIERIIAIIIAMVIAILLFVWSTTFSGLYAPEGSLFVKIVAGMVAVSAVIEIVKLFLSPVQPSEE